MARRRDVVLERIREAAEVTVKVAERDAKKDGKARPRKEPLPPTPVDTPPLEGPPPQMSAMLGRLMDDFKGAKPGDSVHLDGGRVVRTQKGFVSQRHGGETVEHATPHEAAQHLLSTLQLERHEHAVARHDQQHAARRAVHAEVVAQARERERAEESAELEEEIAVPRVGVPLHVHFDPRLHPHDRLGRFQETLAKLMRAPHNSVLHMPHGVAVRRSVTGLTVSGGGEARTLDSVHAAAGEALHRHVQAAVGEGADFRHESARLLEELGSARRQAVAAQDAGGAFHLDRRMAEVRRERSRRFSEAEVPSHRGRTAAARERYAAQHGGFDLARAEASLARVRAVPRGRAKTGAEIEAETTERLGPRPRGRDFDNFYPREYDEDNRLVGRRNEAVGKPSSAELFAKAESVARAGQDMLAGRIYIEALKARKAEGYSAPAAGRKNEPVASGKGRRPRVMSPRMEAALAQMTAYAAAPL